MTQQVRIIRVITFLILVLTMLGFPINAAVYAEYQPESSVYLQMSPGVFTHPNTFGAKLGTLTVYHDQPLYNPHITTTLSGFDVPLMGYFRWDTSNAPWTQAHYRSINMNVLAVSYPWGPGQGVRIVELTSFSRPLMGVNYPKNQEVTVNPFVIEIYILNSNASGSMSTNPASAPGLDTNGGKFRLESPYTFVSPFNPQFTLAVTNTKQADVGDYNPITQSGTGFNIETNGETTPNVNPVIDGGFTSEEGNGGFWYGDEIYNPYFDILFKQSTNTFDLYEAYGDLKKEINTVEIIVNDGDPDATYGVNIAFTDSSNTGKFELKHPDAVDTIEFSLFLEGRVEPVIYGDSIPWNNLVLPSINKNERKLWISGINATQAQQRLSGSYSDTIYVNIISTL